MKAARAPGAEPVPGYRLIEPLGGGGQRFPTVAPYQNRLRLRVRDDVEAVFGTIVDDDIE